MIRDGEYLYHLFSRDFGKITVWANKKRKIAPIDSGSIISAAISTREGKNSFERSETKRVVHTEGLDYAGLSNILRLLKVIHDLYPEWIPNTTIFADYQENLDLLENREQNEFLIELFLLKLLKNSGVISSRNDSENPLSILYHSIDRKPLRSVCLEWPENTILTQIRRVNDFSLAAYLG